MSVLAREHDVESEVDQLREELEQTDGARRVAEEELARHRVMLSEAETELGVTRRALGRERMVSGIRSKLLGEIQQSRPWRRAPALRRAARVERLLAP